MNKSTILIKIAICMATIIVPQDIIGQSNAIIVKAQKSRILKSDGTLWAWGYDNSYLPSMYYGTFSDPNQSTTFTPIEIMTDIADFLHLSTVSYVIRNDRSLWGWGKNYNDYSENSELYVLGDGSKNTRNTPVLIANNVSKIKFSNGWHKGLLKTDKSLWMWGSNRMGQIGKGTSGKDTYQLSPLKVMDDVEDFDCGVWHTVALKTNGSVWVWGNYNVCGLNSGSSYSPVQKTTDARAIAASSYNIYLIKNDNTLWAWGSNDDGMVGNGKSSNNYISNPVKIMDNVAIIKCSNSQCAAIKTDGSLWRWGLVGNGIDGSHWDSPVKVLENVKQVIVDNLDICVLKNDGTLYTNGLGDGTGNRGIELRKILDDVDEILSRNYVRKKDGALWAWEYMIGNGTKNNYTSPQKVMDGAPSKIYVTDIILNRDFLHMRIGEEETLIANILPDNAMEKSITWSSNNPDVATVEDGKVKAVGLGQAVITASTNDGSGVSASCTIIVEDSGDSDISLLDNVIYLESTEVQIGTTTTLFFRMKNSAAIRCFQFDLYLPEGITAAKNSKGKIIGALSNGRLPEDDEHALTMLEQTNGSIHFYCNSEYDEAFTGNEGEILTLTVNITEEMSIGKYPVILRNMHLTEIDTSKCYEHSYVKATLIGLEPPKCATPTIAYSGGKLKFSCETEGVQFVSTITDDDIKSYDTEEVDLCVTYTISVYATKPGYNNSDVATGTLCWIDQQPDAEGVVAEDAVMEVKAVPVLIQTHGGTISIQGLDNGTQVSVYSTDGMQQGSALVVNGATTINTSLQSGSVAIVKIGEKSVKVLVK